MSSTTPSPDPLPQHTVAVDQEALGPQLLDQVSAAVEWLRAIHDAMTQCSAQLAELASSVAELDASLGSLQNQVEELNDVVHSIQIEVMGIPDAVGSAADQVVSAIEMLEVSIG